MLSQISCWDWRKLPSDIAMRCGTTLQIHLSYAYKKPTTDHTCIDLLYNITLLQINNTPLHYAAANGHAEIVNKFLLNGADVNAINDVSSRLSATTDEIVNLLRNIIHCVLLF